MNPYFTEWGQKLSKIYDNPQQIIKWLLKDMGLSIETLWCDMNTLNISIQQNLQNYLERLEQHEPLSKIFESKDFYGREFKTSKDTLDPRHETELMIEAVKQYKNKKDSFSILELGVGTGCIIITLLLEFKNAHGLGVDISDKALLIAQHNANMWDTTQRMIFQKSNWFEDIEPSTYDIILSNPPYIENDFPLDKSVSLYDPSLALFGGIDGLDAYRTIFQNTKNYMHNESFLILEIGFNQFTAIQTLARQYDFQIINNIKDHQNYERCIIVKKNNH